MQSLRISVLVSIFTLTSLNAGPALGKPKSKPFKGNAQGQVTGIVPSAEGLLLTVHSEGNATHLGNFTRDEEVLYNPSTGTVTGELTFTAANGDLLYASVEGAFTSPTTVGGIYEFAGGTGRFINASGVADFQLTTLDLANATITFDGSISY